MEKISAEIMAYIHRGIAAAELDENGHLVFTLTDGERRDLGRVAADSVEIGKNGNWLIGGADTGRRAAEPDFELIATFSTAKGVTLTEVSKDSEGNAFALTSALIYCTFPASDNVDADASGGLKCRFMSDGYDIAVLRVDDIIKAQETKMKLFYDIRGGIAELAAAAGTADSMKLISADVNQFGAAKPLTKIRIQKNGLEYIPEGFSLEIWGIREEAN